MQVGPDPAIWKSKSPEEILADISAMYDSIMDGGRIQEYYMTPAVFQKLYGSLAKPDEVARINAALTPKWPDMLRHIRAKLTPYLFMQHKRLRN